MRCKKIVAALCTFSLMGTLVASAAGTNFLSVTDLQNQANFLLNRENKSKVALDMNCDDSVDVLDLMMMKQIETSSACRYKYNVFDDVEIKKDIVFAQKEDYQNKNVDLALDLYQPKKDNL